MIDPAKLSMLGDTGPDAVARSSAAADLGAYVEAKRFADANPDPNTTASLVERERRALGNFTGSSSLISRAPRGGFWS